MGRWIIVLIIVGISIIGFIDLIFSYRSLMSKKNFSIEFVNKYREFCTGLFRKNLNEELYQWLRLKCSRMQTIMGSYGIASIYQPPFSNIIYRNHQIIVNGLSEIRKEYSMLDDLGSSLTYRNLEEMARMIDDCIILYIGSLEDVEKDLISEMKNPLIWFREGIRFIVLIPISFLHWSGLINYNTYNKLTNNLLVKTITMLITLIGLISSIIGIIQGYDYLVIIFNKIKELL